MSLSIEQLQAVALERDKQWDPEKKLADVIICTVLLANSAGLDLTQAVIEKFNASSDKLGLTTKL